MLATPDWPKTPGVLAPCDPRGALPGPPSGNNGYLDIFVVPSDTGTPITLRTRGGSDAWVNLSVEQARDVARELIRLAQKSSPPP